MLLPCRCFRFTSRQLRVSPTSHRHYCATTVIMSSWLADMDSARCSARRPRLLGDVEVQLLLALSASFGDTGKVGSSHRVSQREPHLHGGVQGSASVHSCEQRRLSGKTLHRGNCRLVQSRNSHFLSAAVDRASALGSAGARAHEEPDMCHQRVQEEALSVAVCGV